MFLDTLQFLASAPVEAGGEEGPLGEIFKTFHIDGWSFAAQLINFLLIAFLLKKFAFGPIIDILEKRRERIASGEEKLKEVEAQIASSERRTEEILTKANDDAKRLIAEAKESAVLLGERKAQDAVSSAKQILAKAEEAAKAEREQMVIELRREFGRLVTATTTQVTGKILTDDDQKRINEEAIAKVS